MSRFVVLLVIVVMSAGLFLYTQQAEAPGPSDAPVGSTPENVFGDAEIVGELEGEESGETPTAPAGTEPPTSTHEEATTASGITRAQLGAHATPSDCWIAYKGTVYDITDWLPRHPGSAAAISPYCGTVEEFAAAFNNQHGTGKDGRLQKEGVEQGTLAP